MIVDNNDIIISKENIVVIKVLELKKRFSFSIGKFLLSFPIFWKISPGIYEKIVSNKFIIPKDRNCLGMIKGSHPRIIEEGWVYSLYDLIGDNDKIDNDRLKDLLEDNNNHSKKLFIVQGIIPKYCQYIPGKDLVRKVNFIGMGSDLLRINKILFWGNNINDLEKKICKQKLGIK